MEGLYYWHKFLNNLKKLFYKDKDHFFDEAIKQDKFYVKFHKPTNRKYTETLLISCVDFRFRNEVEELMGNFLHLEGDYDEVALPGASLY